MLGRQSMLWVVGRGDVRSPVPAIASALGLEAQQAAALVERMPVLLACETAWLTLKCVSQHSSDADSCSLHCQRVRSSRERNVQGLALHRLTDCPPLLLPPSHCRRCAAAAGWLPAAQHC